MTSFPEPPNDEKDIVYLENTDKDLPQTLNPSTRYAYFKTIAKGGKAVIMSCRDLHLSRTICYKKLLPEFADDPVERTRFLREARVSAMLMHPAVVPTYELGRESNGHYYFTMKLVFGYTLREVLDYRERYDLRQLINVLIPVAQALAYAHSHRVIHRDVKPENVLVGRFGETLLLDWGLAKVWSPDQEEGESVGQASVDAGEKVSSLSDSGDLQGTVTYMSPEQVRRDPNIDYRTDIFSLGVILYEILAGRPPTTEETINAVFEQILNEVPEKPSKIAKHHVPRLLEDIAMQCLEKEPENRIADCEQLVRLLEEDWS